MKQTNKSFGTVFTGHMFVMEWNAEQGWHNQRIQPYQDFVMNPACVNLHYGQEIFEGMKAFRAANNNIVLFRPVNHFRRMNRSAAIMCMPEINVEEVLQWLKKLIITDQQWVPHERGTALYIRPTMIASEVTINLKLASSYTFFIILSPVGSLFSQGFNPVSILVTENYTRASSGGVGQAKAAGNYAASMRAQKEAQRMGCVQVLWLDPVERTYVEEVGAMNIFFVIDNILVTPMLTDSILPGITRQSIIEWSKQNGIVVQERRIAIEEVIIGIENGSVQEVFGCGTAAVISPIGMLHYKGKEYEIGSKQVGPLTKKLFSMLTDIQYGATRDEQHWLELIE